MSPSPPLTAVISKCCRKSWRKGWDSNPRYPCRHAGFQDRCLKPLGHPSISSRLAQPPRERNVSDPRLNPLRFVEVSLVLRLLKTECSSKLRDPRSKPMRATAEERMDDRRKAPRTDSDESAYVSAE